MPDAIVNARRRKPDSMQAESAEGHDARLSPPVPTRPTKKRPDLSENGKRAWATNRQEHAVGWGWLESNGSTWMGNR